MKSEQAKLIPKEQNSDDELQTEQHLDTVLRQMSPGFPGLPECSLHSMNFALLSTVTF